MSIENSRWGVQAREFLAEGRRKPHYADDRVTLYNGDSKVVLAELPDDGVDAVVCDPPYELGFMGKGWDASGIAYDVELWAQALRVLKPGGHLLAFGGTRTWHRLACAVEDAGFEVRDSIAWLYGSGFPKSLDVSKAIDKAAGAERELGRVLRTDAPKGHAFAGELYERDGGMDRVTVHETVPATPEAEQWQGWGTALKPAFEPVVVARKPLVGTVAANVLAHGTGALHIDACRIGSEGGTRGVGEPDYLNNVYGKGMGGLKSDPDFVAGRWPANVVLDEDQADALDEQSGTLNSGSRRPGTYAGLGYMGSESADFPGIDGDSGGASRFFYTAKAAGNERPHVNGIAHPTVKPLDLMRWLVKLVTPPGGTVLEPFAGSGTTVEACILEGFACIAVERETDYLPLILDRIKHPSVSAMNKAARSTRKKAATPVELDGLLEGLL